MASKYFERPGDDGGRGTSGGRPIRPRDRAGGNPSPGRTSYYSSASTSNFMPRESTYRNQRRERDRSPQSTFGNGRFDDGRDHRARYQPYPTGASGTNRSSRVTTGPRYNDYKAASPQQSTSMMPQPSGHDQGKAERYQQQVPQRLLALAESGGGFRSGEVPSSGGVKMYSKRGRQHSPGYPQTIRDPYLPRGSRPAGKDRSASVERASYSQMEERDGRRHLRQDDYEPRTGERWRSHEGSDSRKRPSLTSPQRPRGREDATMHKVGDAEDRPYQKYRDSRPTAYSSGQDETMRQVTGRRSMSPAKMTKPSNPYSDNQHGSGQRYREGGHSSYRDETVHQVTGRGAKRSSPGKMPRESNAYDGERKRGQPDPQSFGRKYRDYGPASHSSYRDGSTSRATADERRKSPERKMPRLSNRHSSDDGDRHRDDGGRHRDDGGRHRDDDDKHRDDGDRHRGVSNVCGEDRSSSKRDVKMQRSPRPGRRDSGSQSHHADVNGRDGDDSHRKPRAEGSRPSKTRCSEPPPTPCGGQSDSREETRRHRQVFTTSQQSCPGKPLARLSPSNAKKAFESPVVGEQDGSTAQPSKGDKEAGPTSTKTEAQESTAKAAAAAAVKRPRSQEPGVSAFQRLGPKLPVSDRLGHKDPKTATPGSDQLKNSASVDGAPGQEAPSNRNAVGKDETGMQITITQDEDSIKRVVNDEKKDKVVEVFGKKFIPLSCPHCSDVKLITFNEYNQHLTSASHVAAMRRLAGKLHSTLAYMRLKQRSEQRVFESNLTRKDGHVLDATGRRISTNYCKTCKLLFHQTKKEHNDTKMHYVIWKFRYPECHVCDVRFPVPLLYEKHIGQLSHIKARNQKIEAGEKVDRMESKVLTEEQAQEMQELILQIKKRNNKRFKDRERREEEGEGEDRLQQRKEEEDEELLGEFNEEDFLTLDEVGEEEEDEEADGEVVEEVIVELAAESMETDDGDRSKKKNASSPPPRLVGSEFVKKVAMLYCDLCHKYLPRIDQVKSADDVLAEHCQNTSHCNAYKAKSKVRSKATSSTNSKAKGVPAVNSTMNDEEELDYEAE